MKYKHILLLAVLLTIITSCSGPQKLYEKGKYDKAFDKALSKLKKGKDRKMKTLVNKSFAKMIDQTRDELIYLDYPFQLDDAEKNLKKYDRAGERFDEGQAFLTDENIEKYNGLNAEKESLVSDVYEEGLNLIGDFRSEGRKVKARNAFAFFSIVDKYCNTEYPDMDELLNESYEGGTLVYNVNADLNFEQSYRWEVDRKFDDLEGRQGFVKIVYDQMGNVGDCLVELDFSSLDEDIQESNDSQEYSKNVEDGYTTTIDTSGKEIKKKKYKTVTGRVTTRRLTKRVRWSIDLDVRSMNSDCDLRDERFREEISDDIVRYEIRGDERAIPSKYLRNNKEEFRSTDDMVDDLIDELYREVYSYLY